MVRLTLWCVFCVLVAATQAQYFLEENDIPDTYHFPGFVVLRGTHTFARLGDSASCPVPPWTDAQTKARTRRVLVQFTAPFAKTPVVAYSITQRDMDARYNTRYRLKLIAVNPSAFVLEFGVWCNSISYSAVVTFWVAGVTGTAASENEGEALSYVVTEMSPAHSIYT